MTLIHLTTFIAAPRERVFDLSRSVDLHRQSMGKYGEEAVAGVRNGMMELNDTVTWRAKHLLKQRLLKVKITQLLRPEFFVDEMVEGDFRMMKHEHYFKTIENGTLMIDQFRYQLPYGLLGSIADRLYLRAYMTRLLTERNAAIKRACETN